jgi:hypothetical protein
VHKDATIRAVGNRYSIPFRYIGQRVHVYVGPEKGLWIHDRSGAFIAEHQRTLGVERLVIDPAHYVSLPRPRESGPLNEYERRFLACFPECEFFLKALKICTRRFFPVHVNAILSLLSVYSREQIGDAMEIAFEDSEATATSVAHVLSWLEPDQAKPRRTKPVTLAPHAPDSEGVAFGRISDDEQ